MAIKMNGQEPTLTFHAQSLHFTLMHVFLTIGGGKEKIEKEIERVSKKLNAKVLSFPVQKIEDARNLSSFTKLTQSEKHLLVLENIDEATEEAVNAILKNLEEPQENISFLLTARNKLKVLPTIVSRAQVIKLGKRKSNEKDSKRHDAFLKKKLTEKFKILTAVKKREDAVAFLEDFIFSVNSLKKNNPVFYIEAAREGQRALNNVKANGNVFLQLTNFAIRLEKTEPRV